MQSPDADSDSDDETVQLTSLRSMLSKYMPGSTRDLQGHGVRRVCLQLFGKHGHGKSSLINSCLCVVQDCPFSNEVGAGGSGKPFTMARKEYKLSDTVYIVDNRGLSKMNIDENLEVAAQLRLSVHKEEMSAGTANAFRPSATGLHQVAARHGRSQRKLRELGKVEWEFELDRTVNLLEDRYKNQSMDFIVPVFVHSVKPQYGRNLSSVSNDIVPFLRDAFEITGIFPIVVLTNYTDQNITTIWKEIEELGAQHIFALDNYTTSNSTRTLDTDATVLKFLHACLQEADRGIQKTQNLDAQLEVIRQSVSQIQSEMSRQKEIERNMKEEKDRALNQKERDINANKIEISNLKNDVANLRR
ncbi:uncharacterized protein LOC134945859 isoform X1 [Pseudophryne corroboree]|uniref:uncharacterized protein LOC134945859 isoform X1 n=1 Tax=Pseudophryne corroboree TaxID=495146 RepID=UPI0030816DE8